MRCYSVSSSLDFSYPPPPEPHAAPGFDRNLATTSSKKKKKEIHGSPIPFLLQILKNDQP